MAYLLVSAQGMPTARKNLDGPVTVGRSMECGVSMDDRRLSRKHCRFEQLPDGSWAVYDLNSKNGTIVGGERVTMKKLIDGEEVHAGPAHIIFVAGAEPPPRPADPSESQIAMKVFAQNPSETLIDSPVSSPLPKPMPTPKPRPARRGHRRPARSVSISDLQDYLKPAPDAGPHTPPAGSQAADAVMQVPPSRRKRARMFLPPPGRPLASDVELNASRGWIRSMFDKLTGRGEDHP